MSWLIRAVSWFLAVLPLDVALAIGRFWGFVASRILCIRRRDSLAAIALSFPAFSTAQILSVYRGMFRNLGMSVVEILRMPSHHETMKNRNIRVENRHYADKAFEQGRGVIALSAHTGNWEAMACVVPTFGHPVAIIVKTLHPPALNDFVISSRAKYGTVVIPRKGSLRQSLRWLSQNHVLGFMLDQNTKHADGVYVDFFGRSACTSNGLAILAIKTGAPVLPAFSFREGVRNHRILLGEPLFPPAEPTPENIQTFTQSCAKVVEDAIRSHPDQWIWMHRRWKTQQATQGSVNSSAPTPHSSDEVDSL